MHNAWRTQADVEKLVFKLAKDNGRGTAPARVDKSIRRFAQTPP